MNGTHSFLWGLRIMPLRDRYDTTVTLPESSLDSKSNLILFVRSMNARVEDEEKTNQNQAKSEPFLSQNPLQFSFVRRTIFQFISSSSSQNLKTILAPDLVKISFSSFALLQPTRRPQFNHPRNEEAEEWPGSRPGVGGGEKADPNSNRNDVAHFWVPIPNPSAVFASRSLDRGCHRAMTCTPHRSGQNTEYLSPLLKCGRRTADMLIAHLNFSSGSADDAATLQSLWASLSLSPSFSLPS